MWSASTRVIAAVSGGADSVALLLLLRDLHARGELILEAVAHLNHSTRGESSDQDEAFCRTLAERAGLAFHSARIDVPERARLQRLSIEVAARNARREFLEQVRQAHAADVVATAHTQDDQAETVLLRMVRGAGLRGLGGIAPVRDSWIRPLLTCSRAQLQDELRKRRYTWQQDATNLDLRNPRNRVRHELLPYLEQHFNPSARQALSRLADLARVDEGTLERSTLDAIAQVVQFDETQARLNSDALGCLPEAIARRVVLHALERIGGRSYGVDDVDAVRAVAAGEGRTREISGLRVEHSGASVVLMIRALDRDAAPDENSGLVAGYEGQSPWSVWQPGAPFRFDLLIPGTVQVAETGWMLEAAGPYPPQPARYRPSSNQEVEIDAAGLGQELVVRSRQPGDRVRPLGLGGQKKLQDVFVDRKVSRSDRDRVPIVTDAGGRIVWVAGHVLAEDFRVTSRTKAVIILKLRRVSSPW